jgi:hypothetical protein
MIEKDETGEKEVIQAAAESVETGAETQAAAEIETQGSQDSHGNSTKSDWQKARETMAEQSSQIKALKAELDGFRNSQKLSAQQKSEAKDLLDGRDDDDLLTVADLKKALSTKEAAYKQQLAELAIRSKYPDFDETLQKYGNDLDEVEQQMVLNAPNPYEAAYRLCKKNAKLKTSSEPHENAKKAVENLSKPVSASAVGGAGVLSKASVYASMSEREILDMSNRIIRGG